MSELSPQARAILEEGRAGDEPTEADKERLRLKVAAALAETPPAGEGPAVGLPWRRGRGLAVALLVGGCAALGLWRWQSAPSVSAPPPAMPAASVGLSPAALAPAVAPVAESQLPAAEPAAAPAAEPAAAPAVEPQPPAAEPDVTPAPRPPRRAPPAASARRVETDSLAEELRLLREAQAARRSGSPALALERVREHARRFPEGLLRAEREAAEVLVLCELGQVSEASQRAELFEQRYPDSPLRRALHVSCAVKRK